MNPLGLPGAWRFDAACNPFDADEFFATDRRGKYAAAASECAKDFCISECTVFADCLAWVLADDARRDAQRLTLNEGVWAGTDENERRALLGRKAKTKGRAS